MATRVSKIDRTAISSIALRGFVSAAAVLLASFGAGMSAAQSRSMAPSQIRIAFGADPRTTFSVAWQCETDAPGSVVQYGQSPRLGRTAPATRASYKWETGSVYEAQLTGLRPDREFYYRVGSPSGGWSEVHQSRTAPGAREDFTFTAFGDQGVSPAAKQNVEHIVAEKPAFHLVLGDLSYANGRQPVWDTWFSQNEPMTRIIPFMPAVGNHENEKIGDLKIGYASFLARFSLPAPETRYSFDYSGVRFISFNSDDYQNPEQLKWFDDLLARTKQDDAVRWVVVFMHHPLYSSNVRRLNNTGLIEVMRPRLEAGGVDLVLTGHNHNYERSYALMRDQVTNHSPNQYRRGGGIVYVVSGGGGKSLYQFVPEQPAITAFRESTEHYLRVKVDKRGPMVVEAVRTSDRHVMDRFELRR